MSITKTYTHTLSKRDIYNTYKKYEINSTRKLIAKYLQ